MGVLQHIWRAATRHRAARRYRSLRPERVLVWRPSGNYQSYMIRFWRTNPTVPWRAAVVDPRHDVIRYFTDREALYAFLDAQIDEHSSPT